MSVEPNWRAGAATYFALAATLIGYPLFRMAVAWFDLFPSADGASSWWSMWAVVMVGHWFCVAIVLTALASEKASLNSIGLDVSAFIKGRWVLLVLILAALVAAWYAPQYFYGDDIPERMRSHPLGPVTSAQRVFWVLMAVTAGFVEELVFRGYALTRLRKITGLFPAIVISTLSFALMHGPSAFVPQFLGLYLVSGALFSIAFIALKYRRLEALIIIHASLDLMLVAAP